MAENRGLHWTGPLTDQIARQLTSGPSRLCQAMAIVRTSHNGLDLTNPRSALSNSRRRLPVSEALVTARIGINPSNPALDWPLRLCGPRPSLRLRTEIFNRAPHL